MPLLVPPTDPAEPRRVSFFRMDITFLEELLALPKGTHIVDVTPNGDCSSLEIRIAGESVPDNGPNWCLSPMVTFKKGTAPDGSEVRQLQFVNWEGYKHLESKGKAEDWYKLHGKEPEHSTIFAERPWRWSVADSNSQHGTHELPDAVIDRLGSKDKPCGYATKEEAEADALRAITEAIEAGELQEDRNA